LQGTIFGHYAGGMLTFMIDIGLRTGLFEAAAAGPATSADLAKRAGLSERYVREWLGAIVTGGIMSYDASTRTYALPPEHAACLTGAGSSNLAPVSQLVTTLAEHVDGVVAAFRSGGGVPYERYRPRFTDVMDRLSRGTFDETLIPELLPLVPDLPARLSRGIRVADVGCGTGHAINLMAAAYPRSTFVGYDLAEDAIEKARAEAESLDLPNATFEVLDVATLAPAEPFDVIFAFDAIHDQADPAGVLSRIRASLSPDGWFVLVDINTASDLAQNVDNPIAPFVYGISTLHCLTVSLAAGGAGLGAAWGRDVATRMLHDAGFQEVTVHDAPGDPLNLVYVCR